MKVVEGDLWQNNCFATGISTNGTVSNRFNTLVMGAGVALSAKDKYPDLPTKLGIWVSYFGNIPCWFPDIRIMSVPTKGNWKLPSSLPLIKLSVIKVKALLDIYNIPSIALPLLGCGNGKLLWDEVEECLTPIVDDRFVFYRNKLYETGS